MLAVLAFLAFKTSDCEIFVLRDRLCVSERGPDLARFEGWWKDGRALSSKLILTGEWESIWNSGKVVMLLRWAYDCE